MGSGLDDGAVEIFVNNKHRYKPVILEMLDAELPSSYSAQASFVFGELFLDDLDVSNKITHISENHPNDYIRCFWFDVINGRFEMVKVSVNDEDGFGAFIVRDTGSKCE